MHQTVVVVLPCSRSTRSMTNGVGDDNDGDEDHHLLTYVKPNHCIMVVDDTGSDNARFHMAIVCLFAANVLIPVCSHFATGVYRLIVIKNTNKQTNNATLRLIIVFKMQFYVLCTVANCFFIIIIRIWTTFLHVS